MPTILELAERAELPSETVLRVVMGEPANEAARKSVAAAIADLGPPDYPAPYAHVNVLPAEVEPTGSASVPAEAVGEAVRVEVRSEAEELRALFRDLVEGADRERRERIEDVALTTDLIVEGWRNVDRRLGRLEKLVERLERSMAPAETERERSSRVLSFDEQAEQRAGVRELRERFGYRE
jgi:hypothetical protein